jgi:hypothetical protein
MQLVNSNLQLEGSERSAKMLGNRMPTPVSYLQHQDWRGKLDIFYTFPRICDEDGENID